MFPTFLSFLCNRNVRDLNIRVALKAFFPYEGSEDPVLFNSQIPNDYNALFIDSW